MLSQTSDPDDKLQTLLRQTPNCLPSRRGPALSQVVKPSGLALTWRRCQGKGAFRMAFKLGCLLHLRLRLPGWFTCVTVRVFTTSRVKISRSAALGVCVLPVGSLGCRKPTIPFHPHWQPIAEVDKLAHLQSCASGSINLKSLTPFCMTKPATKSNKHNSRVLPEFRHLGSMPGPSRWGRAPCSPSSAVAEALT